MLGCRSSSVDQGIPLVNTLCITYKQVKIGIQLNIIASCAYLGSTNYKLYPIDVLDALPAWQRVKAPVYVRGSARSVIGGISQWNRSFLSSNTCDFAPFIRTSAKAIVLIWCELLRIPESTASWSMRMVWLRSHPTTASCRTGYLWLVICYRCLRFIIGYSLVSDLDIGPLPFQHYRLLFYNKDRSYYLPRSAVSISGHSIWFANVRDLDCSLLYHSPRCSLSH